MIKYSINKNFIYQNKKNNVLIFDSEKSLIFNLNETATIIFKKLKLGWEDIEIKKFLLKRFSISNRLAKNQVTKTIKELLENNILIKHTEHTHYLDHKCHNLPKPKVFHPFHSFDFFSKKKTS